MLFKDFKPENSLKLGPKPILNRCFERYSRGDLRDYEDFCGTTSADISTASQMVYKMPRACTNGLIRRSCRKFLFFRLHRAGNFRGLISRLDYSIFVSFCALLKLIFVSFCALFKADFKVYLVKGSSDSSHFIFEINVGKSRIRHTTTLKLND